MCLAFIMSASAATDPVGRIHCDVMTELGSYFNGGTPTNGGDTFKSKATAIVSGRTAGQTMNIYAMASVTSPDSSTIYATNQSTEHYKTRTSATTGEVRRGWLQSEITVKAVGLARARYTNNNTSEDWGGGQQTKIGGDYLGYANSTSQESNDNSITIGIGKAQNMISVIKQEFGLDLSSYHYVSFAELWVDDPLPNEILPMRRILGDIFVECEVGDGLPLGFLYQGNEAYTTRKQSDSTLKLTKYKILTPEETQGVIDEDFCYQIVDTEVKPTTQAVVNALYGIE